FLASIRTAKIAPILKVSGIRGLNGNRWKPFPPHILIRMVGCKTAKKTAITAFGKLLETTFGELENRAKRLMLYCLEPHNGEPRPESYRIRPLKTASKQPSLPADLRSNSE